MAESLPECITYLSGGRVFQSGSQSQSFSLRHIRRMSRTSSDPNTARATSEGENSMHATSFSNEKSSGLKQRERQHMVQSAILGRKGRKSKYSMDNTSTKGEGFSSYDEDPKARLFQNRQHNNSSTAQVVAERRLRQEKKRFRLPTEEQENIKQTLLQFCNSGENVESGCAGFGEWLNGEIESLEAENFSDLLCVELAGDGNCKESRAVQEELNPEKVLLAEEDNKAQRLLIASCSNCEDWFNKFEGKLAKYAALTSEDNEEIGLLNVRRKNVGHLQRCVGEILEVARTTEAQRATLSQYCTDTARLKREDYDVIRNDTQFVFEKSCTLSRLRTAEMGVLSDIGEDFGRYKRTLVDGVVKLVGEMVDEMYQGNDYRTMSYTDGSVQKWMEWLADLDDVGGQKVDHKAGSKQYMS